MVKAQAFLLAAVIISVALVGLYIPMKSEYLIRQTSILTQEYENRIFENVFNEIKNAIYFSYPDFDACIHNSFDFLNFSEKYVNSKALKFSSVLIVANISSTLNLTTIDFASDNLNITFILNDSEVKNILVNKYQINSTSFSLTSTTNNITIVYANINKTINFSNNDKVFALIDLSIQAEDFVKRDVEAFLFR